MTDTTRDAAALRVEELKEQYREGEVRLAELTRQEAGLRETLLRISGAIQVLQELLEAPAPAATSPNGAMPDTLLTVP